MYFIFNSFYQLKKYFIHIVLLLLLSGCETNLNYEIHGYTQKIIVEGMIANGQYPTVYLSLNVPVWQQVDSATILNNVIRTAKVTVSDGTKTEILTSSWDKTHFPPYVYKGTSIKGEEGKTYYLTVEYSGYTLHATTTLPQSTAIESIKTLPVEGEDSLRQMQVTFTIDPTRKNSYRIYTKKPNDGFYTETPVLFNAEFSLSGAKTFTVSPMPKLTDPSYDEGTKFRQGDTVFVKLCTIDSVSTQFFKELTFFSSSTGVGNIYFVGEKTGLPSNISTPGFGIWYGNASKTYRYVVE